MTNSNRTVTLGVTRLLESERGIIQGMRVGLIANSASVDENGISTASLLLDAGIRLACLFSPEHGYDASAGAGAEVADSSDLKTGLPVHSLYGATRQPTADMLRDIDAIVFDLQDIGTRCYTYIWTMALALQAAALFGRLFVVLDRPNPIGGVAVQGPMLDPAFASFLGMYSVPLRHGMTAGELALLFNQSFGIGADLAVVRMYGWRRRLWFSDTGLDWRPPSPAIRSPECALAYAGTCLFEGTNISEGRGTASPFRLIGAPWLDPDVLGAIDGRWSAGFALSPRRFTPAESKHAGTECAGFAIDAVDKECAEPVALATSLLAEIAARHPDRLAWNEKHFDAVAGTDTLRRRICAATLLKPNERSEELASMFQSWEEAHRAFEKLRSQYLLYEG
jgi:uncharacterized protein YbbC (DUF1343 family)